MPRLTRLILSSRRTRPHHLHSYLRCLVDESASEQNPVRGITACTVVPWSRRAQPICTPTCPRPAQAPRGHLGRVDADPGGAVRLDVGRLAFRLAAPAV